MCLFIYNFILGFENLWYFFMIVVNEIRVCLYYFERYELYFKGIYIYGVFICEYFNCFLKFFKFL